MSTCRYTPAPPHKCIIHTTHHTHKCIHAYNTQMNIYIHIHNPTHKRIHACMCTHRNAQVHAYKHTDIDAWTHTKLKQKQKERY